TITNCSNNYGPYQHDEKFIPTVIRSCLEGKPIPIYGDGSNIRDWLYVEDHCSAVDTIVRFGRIGETYNIGGLNNWGNLDIAYFLCKMLAAQTGIPVEKYTHLITFVADRPGHDWRYAIDSTKVQKGLGWYPAETFESGIRKTLQWYLDTPSPGVAVS
ncbi:MAG: GDP-mannose 4,6-dehydratase, partial [Nitrospirae bacterium]|nr:GDP-mannose 4,6-dehydratase [Nitrospirota bacterium]